DPSERWATRREPGSLARVASAGMIRLATGDDAGGILEIYAPIVRRRRDASTDTPNASRLRTRTAYDWTAEVSVYVRASHQRRGIGRALYRVLLRLLELQGFRSGYGIATAPNPGSEALHRS